LLIESTRLIREATSEGTINLNSNGSRPEIVRKMVENGYLLQERSSHDRRSIRVRLSAKGHDLRQIIADMFAQQAHALSRYGAGTLELAGATGAYRELERFWIDLLNFNLRGAASGL
ncbi:MAG: winged helix DNA-binding protein, partial [Pseudomonadota bacterium]|nr:winged helix DNA-binding protein [Pseudomonadota bacterium]